MVDTPHWLGPQSLFRSIAIGIFLLPRTLDRSSVDASVDQACLSAAARFLPRPWRPLNQPIRRRSAGQQRTGVQEGPTCRCKRAAPPHRPTRPNRHDRWQPCAGSIELVAPAAASVDVPPASRGAVVPFPATKTSANAPLIAANRANLVMRPFSSCLSLLSQWRQSAMDRAINLEFLWTLPPSSELHPKWSSRIRPPLTE